MNKRKLVRFQLLALVVVLGLLVYRFASGPPRPDGDLVLHDLEVQELRHEALVLQQPARVAVSATGSFESGEGAEGLAAYGWILRRDDRQVVWQMDPAAAVRERADLALQDDTLQLDAGTYDVYFASYGNRLAGHGDGSFFGRMMDERRRWQNDADRWRLVLHLLGTDTQTWARTVEDEAEETLAPQAADLFWTTAPMRSGREESYVFEVQRPVRLRAYGVGEIGERASDFGWIADEMTGERVWETTIDNTEPAGGAPENRRFDAVVSLQPGIYRAAFETDRGHAFGDWYGNPPFDPAGWGLSLYAEALPQAGDAVSAFDPWTTRTPLLRMTEVRNDETRSAQLQVDAPVRLLVYAVGELSGGDNRFDYAWIQRNDSGDEVWKMSREASQPAGGDENNRRELAFVQLDPGAYTVYYQTDGSHAFDDWRNGEPDHPDRWGVTLFPVSAGSPPSAVQVLETPREAEAAEEALVSDGPAPPLGSGNRLVDAGRLGNEVSQEHTLELGEESRLLIVAAGEISTSGRYDYGWIEDAGSGEIVWEMTWENTRPAGGEERNRRFEGVVTLPAGKYVVKYRTDFSHAFGDFGEEAPDSPEHWGIVVEKLDGGR